MDPELKEIEEWEAAALVAIEAWERQRDHKRCRGEEEEDGDEMQKRRHVEELRQQVRQEAATKRAAADAKKK